MSTSDFHLHEYEERLVLEPGGSGGGGGLHLGAVEAGGAPHQGPVAVRKRKKNTGCQKKIGFRFYVLLVESL